VSRPRQVVCHAGHQFSPANVRVNANGSQECVVCARRRSRDWQRAQRARLPVVDDKPPSIALVMWTTGRDNEIRASWLFFATRAAARAAAPRDVPWSVVDVARPRWVNYPSIAEVVKRTREMMSTVYPEPAKARWSAI
jgi:hypothetical protein